MALGVMGLDYHYFYSLTPRVFSNISEGYNQRVESELQNGWIQTRKMMFAFLRPHLKNKNATEIDLFRFPWENEERDISGLEEIETEDQAEKVIQEQKAFWEKMDQKRKKQQ